MPTRLRTGAWLALVTVSGLPFAGHAGEPAKGSPTTDWPR